MSSHDPIPTPHAQRVQDFRRRGLPVLVWAAAVLVSAVLLYTRTQRFEYIGIAEANQFEISAAADGVIESVAVKLLDEIEAGTVVARLDDALLRATLATAEAEAQRLRAELDAGRLEAGAGDAALVADLRRFQADEEERRLDVLSLRVDIETDTVERDRLSLEVERNRPLLEAGFVSASTFDNLRLGRDTVQERIDRNKRLLQATENEYRVAEQRRGDYERRLPQPPDAELLYQPLRDAVEVAMRTVEEIEVQRRALIMRSPVTGQVSQLLTTPGQAVLAGEPIAVVAEQRPSEIVAWLDENSPVEPRVSTRVLVASRRDPKRAAESLVLRVGTTMQAMPPRLWRDPRVPSFARPVVIAAVPALDLVPDELVTVRLLD